MRIRKILVAFPLVALTACAKDEPPPQAPPVPPSLLVVCPAPQNLPGGSLTELQVELLWGRDRANLRSCGERLAAVKELLE